MTIGLDASVTLRLLTGQPPAQAEVARAFVAAAKSPVVISDLVVSETYFALRHHYGVPHLDAVRALSSLLADNRVLASGSARTVLTEMSSRSSTAKQADLVARLIHAEQARDDVSLVTFDRELARLSNVRLLESK